MRRSGFTLVELLAVVAVLTLLLGIGLPSLGKARDMGRLTSCAAQMRQIGVAMCQYTIDSKQRVPPFIFNYEISLPLSGQYGGSSIDTRKGGEAANLYVLSGGGYLGEEFLICPGSQQGRPRQDDSSQRYSSYCTRMPYSWDLFPASTAPCLGMPDPLWGYIRAGGGWTTKGVGFDSKSMVDVTMPFVRLDRRYHISSPVACGSGMFEPAQDALISDAFWDQDHAPNMAPSTWCHGTRFNRLAANGAVRSVKDDGTIAANSYTGAPADADAYNAANAERVWQFFDGNK